MEENANIFGGMQIFFWENGFFNKKTSFIMEKYVFFTKKGEFLVERKADEAKKR